ncbi:(+)-neomenthol dehydrogenase-like [Punica granatum]|uniref:(+)-neomenthol dehydrogenase-like n=1 Tax=Punica granatum TaxID=22663 RepID=A0A6P8DLB7_PUNGR|nr:(+)-neomenthol dehydrogenase-like [Punica granatum]
MPGSVELFMFFMLLQMLLSVLVVGFFHCLVNYQHIPGKPIRDELGDIGNLTKDRIEEILKDFLEDFRQGQLEAKGWLGNISAYKMSKAALIAYTSFLAKEIPSVLVNSICPGFVKTDINGNNGVLSAQEGAESPVYLALLPETGPSGLLFSKKEVCSF